MNSWKQKSFFYFEVDILQEKKSYFLSRPTKLMKSKIYMKICLM